MICQEGAKSRVVISVSDETEDSCITRQLKKSANVEEDCLEGIGQYISFQQK